MSETMREAFERKYSASSFESTEEYIEASEIWEDAWHAALEHAGRGEPAAHMTVTGQFSMSDERGIPPDDSGQWIPLYTQPPAPAVPEGWKPVPVEPTPKMLCAMWEHRDGTPRSENELAAIGYRALLNAAPQPTGGDQ